MNAVKRLSDGEIVYKQDPAFDVGCGIISAIKIFGGVAEDYEEVSVVIE